MSLWNKIKGKGTQFKGPQPVGKVIRYPVNLYVISFPNTVLEVKASNLLSVAFTF